MQATFRHGNPLVCDYTPGSDVAEGDVVVVGSLAGVAHRPIAANTKGALACGGGVYQVTAAGALTAGTVVYWDDTANKVTGTASTHKVFGYVAPGSSAAGDGSLVDVVHTPKEPTI